MDIDRWKIIFPCPECKQEFPVSISQLQDGGIIICPTCKLNNAESVLVKLEEELHNLGKSIQNLKCCLEANSLMDG